MKSQRRGLVVLVAGPDGAGKSSLARHIADELATEVARVVHEHWRPGLLPHPRALVGGRSAGENTRPQERTPHGPVVSLGLLGYYWLDFLFGGWLRHHAVRHRGGVVIVERGWWDIAVDSRRYRLSVPPSVVKALGYLLPRPELALVLYGDPCALAVRKRELAPAEIDRQNAVWATTRAGRDQVVLDATPPKAVVQGRAVSAVRIALARRDRRQRMRRRRRAGAEALSSRASVSGSAAMSGTRIIAFDYACEPGEGSEPGAGWAWACILARLGETWVVTRANNRGPIEQVFSATPERHRLHFVYVDLPAWARFWKKGQRGIRVYYLLWQIAALHAARRLHKKIRFTLAWHLTFANAWFGSLAALIGPPFVYGPVGGGVPMPPMQLLRLLGSRAVGFELTRAAAKGLGRYVNPLARLAWARARIVLVQNRETAGWLPPRHRAKVAVFPNPVLDTALDRERLAADPPTALFAGRLIAWKGVALALKAVAATRDWRLLVCGAGRDEPQIVKFADRLGLDGRVRFLGTQPRDEVFRLMTDEADVLLFPSLREEAGWIVVEALASGIPVICLDRGGPPVLGGDAALAAPVEDDPEAVASSLARLLERALPGEQQARERARHFSTPRTVARLRELLAGAGIAPAVDEEGIRC
jgi:glycosyltransferase involved in cell wall biosynthesis